jgi:hypothetical protein
MGRAPVGVVLLGFVAVLAGIAHLFAGLTLMGYVVFWEGELGSGMFLWGAITTALGIAFMACAAALWSTATWAWLFTNFVAVIGLVDAVFVLLASHDVSQGVAVALLPLVVLWYLHQPGIKAVFRVDESAS